MDGEFLLAAGLARLLGFQDEAAALVKIDAAGTDDAVGRLPLHRAFEYVVVLLGGGSGGIGAGHAEHIAELGQEQGVIGAFLAAFAALPTRDESLGPSGGAVIPSGWPSGS